MRRLYVRIYLAVLASLIVFALAVGLLWRALGESGSGWQGSEMVAQFAQNILPPAAAGKAEQQAALEKISAGLRADVSLFAPQRHSWRGPGLALAVALVLLLLAVAVAAHPVVRRLTRRLERLQAGVETLGRGDLSARVKVEGHDEIAQLATSFNRASARIEELVNAHKMLLANASHELRTPLTRIRMGVELLKQGPDPRRKAELERDIAEIDALIEGILLSSRLDALGEPEVREEVDLLALAAEECARYDGCNVTGGSVVVHGDPGLLRRLLRNLVENALRHGKSPVDVTVAREAGRAALRVSDRGAGIAQTEQEAVFEPFRRTRGAASTGTGLGLSLVRKIARHHGGDARIEKTGPGGLTVLVVL